MTKKVRVQNCEEITQSSTVKPPALKITPFKQEKLGPKRVQFLHRFDMNKEDLDEVVALKTVISKENSLQVGKHKLEIQKDLQLTQEETKGQH